MSLTLEATRRDDMAERIDQLVTLTDTGQSRAHESYLTNQALLEDAAERTGSELGRDALATMREAGRHDYAAHLATVAAVRLEDRGEHADADAMQKEAAARREIAAGMRSDPNPEPPTPEPSGGREWPRGYEPRGSTMSGTNPEIIFEETRESVQPGGNDYSALRQQPTPATVIEEEPQRPAGNVAAAELSEADEGASPLEAKRPDETMTRGITVGIGPGGATIFEINHSPPDAGVDLARADDAARQAERAEQPQQATPEPDTAQIDPAAAYAQEVDQYLTAQQEAAGATPQEMAATVDMLDEQPTEQEIHQAEAMQRDAEASTKRQAAELPGAENLAPAAERSSMADQFRAAYESIKAEKAALEDGNEQGNSQDQDSGRGVAAAFRSFGR